MVMKRLLWGLIRVIAWFFMLCGGWFWVWSMRVDVVEGGDMGVVLFGFGVGVGVMVEWGGG